jgi:hypothetical protein
MDITYSLRVSVFMPKLINVEDWLVKTHQEVSRCSPLSAAWNHLSLANQR